MTEDEAKGDGHRSDDPAMVSTRVDGKLGEDTDGVTRSAGYFPTLPSRGRVQYNTVLEFAHGLASPTSFLKGHSKNAADIRTTVYSSSIPKSPHPHRCDCSDVLAHKLPHCAADLKHRQAQEGAKGPANLPEQTILIVDNVFLF